MKATAKGPDLLKQHVGVVKSRMGTFFPGSHVIFRGQDLHADLTDIDWVELYAFGITGRRFSPEQLRLMHAFWTYTSYPDVRLWNNRVAALAGNVRSTGAHGIAAALAVSEADIYGTGPLARSIDFLLRTRQRVDQGDDLVDCLRDELKTHRNIGGYGRPVINMDERIQPTLDLARQLNLDQGSYLRLAVAVEESLLQGRWRMKMNYAAVVAALGLDLGFTRRELCLLMFPVFLAGMLPCFVEAAERPEGTLFALSCKDILYNGRTNRPWRDANQK
jgi:hypothetical protein